MADTKQLPEGKLGYAQALALLELAPDAIFIAQRTGRFTFVNDAACNLLGYTRSELLDTPIAELLADPYCECLQKAQDLLHCGSNDVTECRLRRKDGTWVWGEVRARALPAGQWQAFVRDISERKAHEAEREGLIHELEADRRLLRTALDALPLGVLLFQPGGQLFFNRRSEELLGIKLSPAGGSAQYASRILFRDGSPVPPEQLVSARVLRSGETVTAEEYLIERQDGSRIPILGSAAPIRDADDCIIGGVGVFQDISERMRMEEAIRANERLLQDIIGILPVGNVSPFSNRCSASPGLQRPHSSGNASS